MTNEEQSTRKLLADYAEVLNEHGPKSREAKEFLDLHRLNTAFQELAQIATVHGSTIATSGFAVSANSTRWK